MIQCIIIEDELYAANNLEYLLKNSKFDVAINAKLSSVKDAVEWLRTNKTDLIFLDVHLTDGVSFTIFEELQITTPIIFTTSYTNYAIDAFKLNTVGYLLKPVDLGDLNAALLKYSATKAVSETSYDEQSNNAYQRTFLIESAMQLHRFNDRDICFVYVLNKHVFIQLNNGTQLSYGAPMEQIEQRLDPKVFFRINRQFIVNKSCIVKMTNESRGRVTLETRPASKQNTTVSVERATEFKQWLNS